MQDQISDFKDLLARIDGLVNAAWNAQVDPRLARQLAAIRQRVVRIQGHLTGEANPGFPAPLPQETTLEDNEELVAQFGALVNAAKGSGLSSTLTHYLHNARLRFTFFLRSDEHRLASRRAPEPGRTAHIQWQGQSIPGTLIDASAFGVGLETDTYIEPNNIVRLVVEGPNDPQRVYECVVVHASPLDSGYHLGLEIFTSKI